MTMEQREWRLRALSPLDGRYGKQMEPFAAVFSEAALIRERFAVEVAWLRQLAALPEVAELAPLSESERIGARPMGKHVRHLRCPVGKRDRGRDQP